MDTHGGRFGEGPDTAKSYEILDKYLLMQLEHLGQNRNCDGYGNWC